MGATDPLAGRASPHPRSSSRVGPVSGEVPATRLDHVCALHRTDALRADPLDAAPIAEDWLWGQRHRCALVVDAPVLHSHPPGLRASFQRTQQLHRVMMQSGAAPTVPTAATLLRALPGVIGDRDALGELLGQYAARGASGVTTGSARS